MNQQTFNPDERDALVIGVGDGTLSARAFVVRVVVRDGAELGWNPRRAGSRQEARG